MSRTLSLQTVLAVLMVTSVATAGVSAAVVTNDRFEPNDTRESAPEIDAGEYEGLTLSGDERDLFALSVGAGEPISVTVTAPKPADGDEPANEPELSLLDANGDEIEDDFGETDPADGVVTYRIDHEFDSPQTVYIEFEGVEDSGTSTEYDLTLRRAENDPNEPNGVLSKATAVSPGTHEGVLQDEESDYFSIDVGAGETLNTTLEVPKAADGEPPDNDIALELVDGEGNEIEDEFGETAPADEAVTYRVHHEFRNPQTVYVRIYGTEDTETSTEYDLTLRRAENDPNEPNGVLSKATAVSPGTHSAVLQDEESDYFSIDVGAGETLNTTLTVPKAADGEPPDNDIALELVDGEGDEIEDDFGETDPADEAVTYRIHHEFRNDRAVYVRVYGTEDSDTSTGYDLTLRRADNDPNEPNGVLSKATSISPGTHTAVLQDEESDYYALSVGPDGPVDVTMTVPKAEDGEPPDNDIALELVDGEGDEIEDDFGETDPAADVVTYRLDHTFESRQTVYLRVYGTEDSDTSTDYEFSVTGAGATTPTPTATPTATPTSTPDPGSSPTATGTTDSETPATGEPDRTASTDADTPADDGSDGGADEDEDADGEDADDGSTSAIGPGFGPLAAVLALLALALGRRRV